MDIISGDMDPSSLGFDPCFGVVLCVDVYGTKFGSLYLLYLCI